MGSRVCIQLGASSFGTTFLLIKLFPSHPKQLVKNAIGVDSKKKEEGDRSHSLALSVLFSSILLYFIQNLYIVFVVCIIQKLNGIKSLEIFSLNILVLIRYKF